MSATDDEIDDRLAALLADYEAALDGDFSSRPSSNSAALQDDPELRAHFDEAVSCLELLDRVRRLGLPGQDDQETLGWRADAHGSSPDTPAATTKTLGRFRIVHELGRGGLGIVYLAYDPKLGRQVALKIPRIESLASDESQRRFLREAEAAARLSHPNLISVFDAGEEGPIGYIASEYCPGPTLAQWLRQRDEPAPPRWAAECVQQLAAGVQHAHGRGVLHRDIKPSNVLLAPLPGQSSRSSSEPADAYCPKLADFGMAKLLEHANDQTRSGALIGTPAYMAPEQAAGQLRDVDARADVYALGVVLYELLTARRPFEGASDVEIIARVISDEPKPPSRLRPEIPRDLAAICVKCLEKEPARRYATAQQLADDLARFLRGEPTEARPPRVTERLWKWARRRPVVAGLSAALAVLLVTIVVGSVTFNVKLQAAVTRLQRGIYASEVRLAQDAMLNNDTSRALQLLRQHAPEVDDSARGEFAWQYLTNTLHRARARLPKHPGDVYSLSFAPDGRRLATACRDGRVRIWDWRRQQLLSNLGDHRSEVSVAVFSPDGGLLASGDDEGRILIRNGTTYAVRRELAATTPDKQAEIVALLFSADAARLYVGAGNTLQVWEVATGERLAEAEADEDPIRSLALSPDGQLLASVHFRLKLWRSDGLELVRQFEEENFKTALFASNEWLVGARSTSQTSMFDVSTGKFLSKIRTGHSGTIGALSWSPDRQALVSGGSDELVNVSIAETAKHLATLRGHTNRVWDVKVAPSGDTLASAGADGEVLLWDMPHDARFRSEDGAITVHSPADELSALAYSPSGNLVACAGRDTLAVVDLRTRQEQALPVGDRRIVAVHFSSEVELIAADLHGVLIAWDLRTGRPTERANLQVDVVRSLAMSPDGRRLAVAVHSGGTPSLRVFSWPDHVELHHLRCEEALHFVRFSPDGRQIVLAGVGLLALFDAESLVPSFKLQETPGAYFETAYLPDGKRMLVAEGDRGLTLRDARTGQLLSQLSGHVDPVIAVAANPNGRNAASVDERGNTCVWDLVTEQVLLQFQDIQPLSGGFCFSPEGDQLAAIRREEETEAVTFDATARGSQPQQQASSIAP
jgi:serine/threonine protein kinase/WD40 repeat protein